MLKIGVFGGSFNPMHNGHLHLLLHFATELQLDRLLVIPTHIPPHKTIADLAAGTHRLEMCKLACREISGTEVSDLELVRGEKSYTVITLEQLREQYPEAQFYFLMGSDMFLSVESWYRYERIRELAVLCTAAREDGELQKLQIHAAHLEKDGAQTVVFTVPAVELSSTQIREHRMFGEDISEKVPPAVNAYIDTHDLYSFAHAVERFDALLRERLDDYRYHHSICVAKAAEQLALRYGGNPKKAYLTGLLHDITKQEKPEVQLQILAESDIICDSVERQLPALWHAITGSWYLKHRLGISDPDVLNAVRYHTTGRAGMSLLEQLVYLADFISEDRSYPDVDVMRQQAYESIPAGMLYALRYTIVSGATKNQQIGINSVNAYNEIVGSTDFNKK